MNKGDVVCEKYAAKTPSFVYHYHATKQHTPNSIIHIDGLLYMGRAILDLERYHDAKKLIVADQGLGSEEGLVINSLSLLHEVGNSLEGWKAE